MKAQAEKAFQEMLDISTDIDKAVLLSGEDVLASNFPESVEAEITGKARALIALGDLRAKDMGSQPLTQLVVETAEGSVFLVRDVDEPQLTVLSTGKKDSRIGLVFYDMKTCIRDAKEPAEEA